ncbi:hypothetical protein JQM70_06930 [Streptococcus pasteurianus]|nr:hypothetical protein [Streptococcus pasteurianus]
MLAIGRSPKKELIAIPKLKFRAWFKQGSKMVNVATIDSLEKEVKSHANVMYSFDEIELMQSTGLFDMYDKEIFNGDVLKTYDGELAKVVWNKYLGCWEARFIDEIVDLSEVADIKYNRSDCEVVGNIYENPEFLEEEE